MINIKGDYSAKSQPIEHCGTVPCNCENLQKYFNRCIDLEQLSTKHQTQLAEIESKYSLLQKDVQLSIEDLEKIREILRSLT